MLEAVRIWQAETEKEFAENDDDDDDNDDSDVLLMDDVVLLRHSSSVSDSPLPPPSSSPCSLLKVQFQMYPNHHPFFSSSFGVSFSLQAYIQTPSQALNIADKEIYSPIDQSIACERDDMRRRKQRAFPGDSFWDLFSSVYPSIWSDSLDRATVR